MNPTKKFTLSSGAKVDDDDEAEIDQDPEAKNHLEKKASVMLFTCYILKLIQFNVQCLLNVPSIDKSYDIRDRDTGCPKIKLLLEFHLIVGHLQASHCPRLVSTRQARNSEFFSIFADLLGGQAFQVR